jgi:hypothetical protein
MSSRCQHDTIIDGTCTECGESFSIEELGEKGKDIEFVDESDEKYECLSGIKIERAVINLARDLKKSCDNDGGERSAKINALLYVCIYKACCILDKKLPTGIPEKMKIKKSKISHALTHFIVTCDEYRTIMPQITDIILNMYSQSEMPPIPIEEAIKLYYTLTDRSQFLNRSNRKSVISGILFYLYQLTYIRERSKSVPPTKGGSLTMRKKTHDKSEPLLTKEPYSEQVFQEKVKISPQTLSNVIKNIKKTLSEEKSEIKTFKITRQDISVPKPYVITIVTKGNFNIDLQSFFNYMYLSLDIDNLFEGDIIHMKYLSKRRGLDLHKTKKPFKASVTFYMFLEYVMFRGKKKPKFVNCKLSSNGSIHMSGIRGVEDVKKVLTRIFQKIRISENMTNMIIYRGNNFRIDNSPNVVFICDVVMSNTVSQFPACINREKFALFINKENANYVAVYDPVISNDSHVRIIKPKQKKEHLIKIDFSIDDMWKNTSVLPKVTETLVKMDDYPTIYERKGKKNETTETFMVFSSGKIIQSSSLTNRDISFNEICDKLIKGANFFCV